LSGGADRAVPVFRTVRSELDAVGPLKDEFDLQVADAPCGVACADIVVEYAFGGGELSWPI
jgi:hypothetical protein